MTFEIFFNFRHLEGLCTQNPVYLVQPYYWVWCKYYLYVQVSLSGMFLISLTLKTVNWRKHKTSAQHSINFQLLSSINTVINVKASTQLGVCLKGRTLKAEEDSRSILALWGSCRSEQAPWLCRNLLKTESIFVDFCVGKEISLPKVRMGKVSSCKLYPIHLSSKFNSHSQTLGSWCHATWHCSTMFSLEVSIYYYMIFARPFKLQRICCIKQMHRAGKGFSFLQFFRMNLGCYSTKWNISVLLVVVVLHDPNICLS